MDALCYTGEIINNTPLVFAIDNRREEVRIVTQSTPWGFDGTNAIKIARAILHDAASRQVGDVDIPSATVVLSQWIVSYDSGYPFVINDHQLQQILSIRRTDPYPEVDDDEPDWRDDED